MNERMKQDAFSAALAAIHAVSPDEAVRRALEDFSPQGDVYLVSTGKAGWQMAKAALEHLNMPIREGIVVTKYDHVKAPLLDIQCFEAGHPVPDENSFRGTQAVLDMTADLKETDTVLFLLSGGGSALFEKPLISGEELRDITGQLLACGADIVEMNTIRKRLSAVKGGRFALHCAPAQVYGVVLSDILGDPLDMIASGPAAPDPSTCTDALKIVEKYQLRLSDNAMELLRQETPKQLHNVQSVVIGSVKQLCKAAAAECKKLGYEPLLLTDRMDGEAREMGYWLGTMLSEKATGGKKLALIAGGETVVHLKGKGLGGRNQELALAAAEAISGIPNVCLISVGSDGTDGPTDAAGGYVDGSTRNQLGHRYRAMLDDNDAYHALQITDGLVITGPTGTNVNDVTIGLVDWK